MLNQEDCTKSQVLAIPKMPVQHWSGTYELRKGLTAGTIFPDLDKPFYMGGVQYGRQK